MPEPAMIWNIILTCAAGGIVWWVKCVTTKIEEINRNIAATREEIARDYALKSEVDKDVQKLLDRFDRFEVKLDNLIDRIISRNDK